MNDERQIKIASGLNLLVGIWLIVSPFLLGFRGRLGTNDVMFGIIIGIVALIRWAIPEESTGWASWINSIAGLWVFLAPFFLGFVSMAGVWNNLIVGIIGVGLAVWSVGTTSTTSQQPKAV